MAEGGVRSRSEEKGRLILGAARELFLEHGFSDVSMDAVTARAGVSKATVYGHFATKEELFAAVIRSSALRKWWRGWRRSRSRVGIREADLEAFSVAFQASALVPEARAWQRLVIAEAQRRPELAQTLYESGPAKVLAMLETLSEERDGGWAAAGGAAGGGGGATGGVERRDGHDSGSSGFAKGADGAGAEGAGEAGGGGVSGGLRGVGL